MSACVTVARFWRACDARDWTGLADLLAEDVHYEIPQTRERVTGRDRYIRFNAEFPGDWRIVIEKLVGEDNQAASWIRFVVGDTEQPGISFFELNPAGRIRRVTDFWPAPYQPPAGREHLVERY